MLYPHMSYFGSQLFWFSYYHTLKIILNPCRRPIQQGASIGLPLLPEILTPAAEILPQDVSAPGFHAFLLLLCTSYNLVTWGVGTPRCVVSNHALDWTLPCSTCLKCALEKKYFYFLSGMPWILPAPCSRCKRAVVLSLGGCLVLGLVRRYISYFGSQLFPFPSYDTLENVHSPFGRKHPVGCLYCPTTSYRFQ